MLRHEGHGAIFSGKRPDPQARPSRAMSKWPWQSPNSRLGEKQRYLPRAVSAGKLSKLNSVCSRDRPSPVRREPVRQAAAMRYVLSICPSLCSPREGGGGYGKVATRYWVLRRAVSDCFGVR